MEELQEGKHYSPKRALLCLQFAGDHVDKRERPCKNVLLTEELFGLNEKHYVW